MEIIRQPPRSGLCLPCCLAMLTNRSLNYVLSKVHLRIDLNKCPLPYLSVAGAIRYLIDENFLYGGPLNFSPPLTPAEGIKRFSADVLVGDCNALLTVKSKILKDGLHAVVWDGTTKTIFDPQHDEPKKASEYEIIEWATIMDIREL